MAQQYCLVVGNTGVGKSTLLNGLIGEPRFKSGFSAGQGITTAPQKEFHGGVVYVDTPGLEDVTVRKQAAAAISEALKQNGLYRIFFVVTLEAGRLRPCDRASMELVLNAAPEIGSQYGVIINKLEKRALAYFQENKGGVWDQLLAGLFHGIKSTVFVHYCLIDHDLLDADNMVKPVPEELRDFICRMPPIEIHKRGLWDLGEKLEKSTTTNILMVGNSGTGKSTLLNCLLGYARFKSGLTYGTGMTYELQMVRKDNTVYMDTPGFSESRKKAAEAISTALQQNGNYKVFFVFTMECGRIRASDKATMQIVLDAAPTLTKFGVIFNKVPKTMHENLLRESVSGEGQSPNEVIIEHLHHGLTKEQRSGMRVFHNLTDDDLQDADDFVKDLPTSLRNFIEMAPLARIMEEDVRPVNAEKYGGVQEKAEREFDELTQNIHLMAQEFAENKANMQRMQWEACERDEKVQQLRGQMRDNKEWLDGLLSEIAKQKSLSELMQEKCKQQLGKVMMPQAPDSGH